MNSDPLIVEIKRHSLEDGPGIRSVVFFKGCPLRCLFCQNPETQEAGGEIAFSARACIRCDGCLTACTQGAVDPDFPLRIRREKCNLCGRCAAACPGRGLRFIGRQYLPEELAGLLLRDRAFYQYSGGGVTLSGGECTLYPRYLEQLLRLIKAQNLHVTVQTCGFFDYAAFQERILPHADLIHYDLKFADPGLHRKFTGRSNQRIISNLQRLLRQNNVEVQPRIPLVPGITATRENLAGLVDLLCELGAKSVTLLPYNPMGTAMAACLGRPRPLAPETFTPPQEEKELMVWFQALLAEQHTKSHGGEPMREEVHP